MALSGQLPGVYLYDNTHYHFIRWTATQNISNNTSTVKAELCITLTSRYGVYYPNSYSQIVLDGTTYSVPYNSALTNPGAGTHVLGSYSKTISHGSDGSKTFTLSGRHNKSGNENYCNFPQQSFTLDQIPRGFVYVRAATSAGSPVRGQVYVRANSSTAGAPVKAKEVYVGDASGVPRKAI